MPKTEDKDDVVIAKPEPETKPALGDDDDVDPNVDADEGDDDGDVVDESDTDDGDDVDTDDGDDVDADEGDDDAPPSEPPAPSPASTDDVEIKRVHDLLRPRAIVTEADTDSVDDEPAPPPAAPPRRRKKNATHVVTDACGELRHNGKSYLAGEGVVLTPEEAAALGPAVVEPV